MVEYIGREVLLKDENGEVIIPYVDLTDYAKSSDIDNISNTVNNLDARITSVSNSLSSQISAIRFVPNYSAGISTTSATYTCPNDGWLYVRMLGKSEANTRGYAYINGKEVGVIESKNSRSIGDSSIFIPVSKGDILTFSDNIKTTETKIFYPFK